MMNFLKKLIIYTLSIVLLLFALDGYLFLTRSVERSITDFCNETGRVRPKNKTFVLFNEGFGIGRFNNGRYLGPYRPVEKEDNEFRIAILGDSYIESFQVFEEENFIFQTQEILNNTSKDSIYLLNFGRSGFNFDNMLAYYYTLVQNYKPDIVLFFIAGTDFSEETIDPLIPEISFHNDTVFITRDYPEKYLHNFERINKITSKSSLAAMLDNSRKLLEPELIKGKLLEKLYHPREIESDMKSSYILLSQIDLESLEYFSKQENFILVNRSDTEIQQSLRSLIDSLNIPYISLTETLQRIKMSGKDPNYWEITSKNGHWNNLAHESIANYLSAELYQIIYPE